MRALSISQPWAHLIVHASKRIENRSTRLFGAARAQLGHRIAIHAAKSYDEDGDLGLAIAGIKTPDRADLPSGAVVGTAIVKAVHVLPWSELPEDQRRWARGPLVILLDDVVALRVPITCRGMLGFWPLPDLIVSQLAGGE